MSLDEVVGEVADETPELLVIEWGGLQLNPPPRSIWSIAKFQRAQRNGDVYQMLVALLGNAQADLVLDSPHADSEESFGELVDAVLDGTGVTGES